MARCEWQRSQDEGVAERDLKRAKIGKVGTRLNPPMRRITNAISDCNLHN